MIIFEKYSETARKNASEAREKYYFFAVIQGEIVQNQSKKGAQIVRLPSWKFWKILRDHFGNSEILSLRGGLILSPGSFLLVISSKCFCWSADPGSHVIGTLGYKIHRDLGDNYSSSLGVWLPSVP